MRKGIMKKIILAAVIAGLIFFIYSFLKGCGENIGTVYRYEPVSRGEIKKTVSVSGKIEVLNSYFVLSKMDGIVNRVYVDFNDRVKKGQLLATMDSSEIDRKILKVEAEQERMELELLAAKNELNAKKELLLDNLISKKAVELAELNYMKAESQLNQVRLEHKIIKKSLSNTRITSPSSGIVISREIEANVPVNQNKVLFIIAEDLKEMRLILHVDESDIGFIKKGQEVKFTVSAFPEKIFKGAITQVRLNPVTRSDGQIVSYQSLVTCDNSELLLKPGMTATATVIVYNKQNALRAPNEAFIVSPVEIEEETGKKYLWKKKPLSIDTMPLERVEVETGVMGDYFTEIISGDIKEGDEILVSIEKKLESNKGPYEI